MRLRAILLQLTILAFLSALIGVYVHYTSLQTAFLRETEERAQTLMNRIESQLASYLAEQLKPVRALAGLPKIRAAFLQGDQDSLARANELLDHFQGALGVDVCYLMDPQGETIASSNRMDPDSFVGRNFSFRPYFKGAMRSTPVTYMALGTRSGKRGVYYSYPVFGDSVFAPAGVVVIKASIIPIEDKLEKSAGVTALLVDPNGIVFVASDEEWVFKSLGRLSEQRAQDIGQTRQFGAGPWPWAGTTRTQDNIVRDRADARYLIYEEPVEHFEGWNVTLLLASRYDYLSYLKPFFSRNRPLVLPLLAVICFFVILLYRKASSEVLQRRTAETALRESEERFRTLYHNTPAMLHSIDSSSRLVSVSDYWTDVLGYAREEAIGHPLTDFMSDESRRYAEAEMIPEFLRTGFCKDVAYQFIQRDGKLMDVLLSATAERDAEGNIRRSLAVLVDVTEQKRTERRLKKAQEKLRSYSKDLERQVWERTVEISNILKYTPSVVSLKDSEGRYLLANSRFEELFGVDAGSIRGKTDGEIFPPQIADRLGVHDREVISSRASFSVEETIPQEEEMHTYLSVKFPLFDERGGVNGVGSVSTDVTALKQAQEKLRQLSNRIVDSQEKERAAISRELHDELGQILLALKMDAVWLHKRLERVDDQAAHRALAMCDMIDATIDDVRGIVMRLRPSVLDDLGLIAALEWVTDDFEKRTGISCTFKHSGVPKIGDGAATATYRIAQEALTNVARHSQASRVEVGLESRDGELLLTVRDDGLGFAREDPNETEGHGIAGIRERASLIGGTIDIASHTAAGAIVSFHLPIHGRDSG
jgi:PAS domain S-box-containing protein